MKKRGLMVLTVVAAAGAFSLTAAAEETVTVFAAASLTETLEKGKEIYEELHPGTELVFNFDSSGTLKTQIEEGADCDVFISAAEKQMDQLDIEAGEDLNTDGLDFIDHDTRLDLLENKVVLAAAEGNPAGVESFEQLFERLEAGDIFLAAGNEDVPVGQYTVKIFDYFGMDMEEAAAAGLITYGSNVKEVTVQVSEGTVDCGIVYCTDAFSAGLEVVDEADEAMCGRVLYPAAVTKNAADHDAAKEYLDFLSSDEMKEIFEEVGFTPVWGDEAAEEETE